jgi:hypothetical protein
MYASNQLSITNYELEKRLLLCVANPLDGCAAFAAHACRPLQKYLYHSIAKLQVLIKGLQKLT